MLVDPEIGKQFRDQLFNPWYNHIGVFSGNHPIYGNIFLIDFLSTEKPIDKDIKKYKIDSSLWPKDYIKVEKSFTKEELGKYVIVTLWYIFLMKDRTQRVLEKQFKF